MLRLIFLSLVVYISVLILWPVTSAAIYNPLSVPNNRIGVHILEPSEIVEASKLVNSSGGDWGYVTIPIRIDDRDLEKWSLFFNQCRTLHVIPVIRLASYAGSGRWVTPAASDLLDFANFLNNLSWPVKNRYIILFNEPNHAAEWGGYVSPPEYSNIILDAHTIFKSRSEDYFLLSSGLDMSAPSNHTSLDALKYYRLLTSFQPDWYGSLDGLSVHAYPHPGYTASVFSTSRYGITSYRYELSFLKSLGFPDKPVFITETGKPGDPSFFSTALTSVWTEKNIVAITPFLLNAAAGDFAGFSLMDKQGQPTASYRDIFSFPKTPGSPLLSIQPVPSVAPVVSVSPVPLISGKDILGRLRRFFRQLTGTASLLTIGNTLIKVEIADSQIERSVGLSNRENLSPDHGMLFNFPQPGLHQFWMKDMIFPLDFIWINGDRVVGLTPDVLPPSATSGQPLIILPDVPVSQVLEVNAGFIATHGIKVNDNVSLAL